MKEAKLDSKRISQAVVTGIVTLSMVACLGLVGCGGSSEESTEEEETSTEEEATDEEETSTDVSGSITAVGSTALQPLAEAAAEQYQEEYPDVSVTIQGGGSGEGITQIVEGSVEIGNSDVFAEEKVEDDADLEGLVDNKVCVVGMGPVVNEDVEIDDISTEDLAGIFTGEITNWSEVGGQDEEITVINRAEGSGTRATFENAVLDGEEVPSDFTPQEQDSSGTVLSMVAETPGSISYLAFSYYDDTVKALTVDGVEPTTENVSTNDWEIWSYEHMYTREDADEATNSFIDYMFSDEVQDTLVDENGYIAIDEMQVERDADGNVTEL